MLAEGANVLFVSHGNLLRALVKNLDGISDQDIEGSNFSAGIPLVYEFSGAVHQGKYVLSKCDKHDIRKEYI